MSAMGRNQCLRNFVASLVCCNRFKQRQQCRWIVMWKVPMAVLTTGCSDTPTTVIELGGEEDCVRHPHNCACSEECVSMHGTFYRKCKISIERKMFWIPFCPGNLWLSEPTAPVQLLLCGVELHASAWRHKRRGVLLTFVSRGPRPAVHAHARPGAPGVDYDPELHRRLTSTVAPAPSSGRGGSRSAEQRRHPDNDAEPGNKGGHSPRCPQASQERTTAPCDAHVRQTERYSVHSHLCGTSHLPFSKNRHQDKGRNSKSKVSCGVASRSVSSRLLT